MCLTRSIPVNLPFLSFSSKNGVSYPVGGSSEFAFHMVPLIESSGGKCFVRADVSGIVLDPSTGAATGVRMKKDGEIISAPIIISNAGLYNTKKLVEEGGGETVQGS